MAANQKAFIEFETGDEFKCLFNPSELSIANSNTWQAKQVPGKSTPDLFFTGGQPGTMDLSLTFDTTADGTPVTKYTNKLMAAMKVDQSLPLYDANRNRGRPPWVKFHWGTMHSFKAVITDLNITFTYFSSKGRPLRARVQLSLTQYEDDAKWGRQNPTSGTPDPHRVHQVQRGETLDRLAALYYGDAGAWRQIAQANRIDDPLLLEPGSVLVIPKRTETGRG